MLVTIRLGIEGDGERNADPMIHNRHNGYVLAFWCNGQSRDIVLMLAWLIAIYGMSI